MPFGPEHIQNFRRSVLLS